MKRLRQLHLYLGLFFAPSILLFAVSGALQTFNLHEGRKNDSYSPPGWVRLIARIHMHQRMEAPPPRREPEPVVEANAATPTPTEARPRPQEERPEARAPREPRRSNAPMKYFVLAFAFGLSLTTILGVIMAFLYNRDRRIVWTLLLLGVLLPLAAMLL